MFVHRLQNFAGSRCFFSPRNQHLSPRSHSPISSLAQLHLSDASTEPELREAAHSLFIDQISVFTASKRKDSYAIALPDTELDLGQRNLRDQVVHVVLAGMGFISPAWFRHSAVSDKSGFLTWSCGTHRGELQAPFSG